MLGHFDSKASRLSGLRQASLRDAGGGLGFNAWVETHAYHREVATRLGEGENEEASGLWALVLGLRAGKRGQARNMDGHGHDGRKSTSPVGVGRYIGAVKGVINDPVAATEGRGGFWHPAGVQGVLGTLPAGNPPG